MTTKIFANRRGGAFCEPFRYFLEALVRVILQVREGLQGRVAVSVNQEGPEEVDCHGLIHVEDLTDRLILFPLLFTLLKLFLENFLCEILEHKLDTQVSVAGRMVVSKVPTLDDPLDVSVIPMNAP